MNLQMAMRTIELELIGSVNIYLGLGIEITTALILGGLVGYDREKKMKSAGIKTNILICLGATLYTSVSLLNLAGATGMSDPNRVTAQIVSGIGFLGAGAIIRGGGGVIGLTTAATMWVVAAIGMTIGLGYPLIATIFTVTILVVLKLLGPLYLFMESHSEDIVYRFQVLSRRSVKNFVQDTVESRFGGLTDLKEEKLDNGKQEFYITFYMSTKPTIAEHLDRVIMTNIKVKDVSHVKAHKSVANHFDDED